MGLGRIVVALLTNVPSDPLTRQRSLRVMRGLSRKGRGHLQIRRVARALGAVAGGEGNALAPCGRGQLSVSTNRSRVRGSVVKAVPIS
jgi:hypothetical protein